MKQILIFSGLVFVGTLAFLQMGGPEVAGPEIQSSAVASTPEPTESSAEQPLQSAHKVTIQRGSDSHFRTTVEINGTPIQMLVDSGATSIALTRKDAERIGIFTGGDSDFSASAQTAGGTIRIKPVRLERVAVGGLERRDIDAAVMDMGDGMSLLGQSYLSKIGSVSIKDDVMTLE